MKKIEEYTDSQLQDIFDAIEPEDGSDETRLAYARVASRLGLRSGKNSFRRAVRWTAAAMAAACIAAVLFFGGTMYQSSVDNDIVWTELVVPSGENHILELSDGTTLTLKSGSRVTYPSRFSAHSRQIFLDGEVFAQVTKNLHKPFVISSGEVSVRVLGTVFDFKAYSTSTSAEISLAEGSVEMLVKSGKSNVNYTMTPGDVLQYDRTTGNVTKRYFSPDFILKMSDSGSMHFMDQRLGDIVEDLERIFGRKIVIADEKLSEKRFDAWFSNDETLDEIISSLNADGSMRVSERNGVLYIFKK